MFLQVIQAKTSDAEGLKGQLDRWSEELASGAEGFAGSTAGVSEGGDFVGVVRFESEEAARKNSERPEQSEWWEATSSHLDGEATFHDCREVDTTYDYTEDTAGFVQVMLGRSGDPDRHRSVESELLGRVLELRTEMLGVLRAWDGDFYVGVAYFASEHTAREGEGKVLPDDLQESFNEWQSLFEELTYVDLQDPKLLGP